jgi:hypothetical protein
VGLLSAVLFVMSATLWTTRVAVEGLATVRRGAAYASFSWAMLGLSMILFVAAAYLRRESEYAFENVVREEQAQSLVSIVEDALRSTLAMEDNPRFDGFVALSFDDDIIRADDYTVVMAPGSRHRLIVTMSSARTPLLTRAPRRITLPGRQTPGPVEFEVRVESSTVRFDPDAARMSIADERCRTVEFAVTAAEEPGVQPVIISIQQGPRLAFMFRLTFTTSPET